MTGPVPGYYLDPASRRGSRTVLNPWATPVALGCAICAGGALAIAPMLGPRRPPRGEAAGTAANLHRLLSRFAGPAFPDAYFAWLCWALLAVCATVAVLALCPLPQAASDTLRVLSVVLGLLGAVLPIAAVALTVQWAFRLGGRLGGKVPSDTPIHYTLTHAGAGTYVASAGFLLLGITGAFGPMRSTSRP